MNRQAAHRLRRIALAALLCVGATPVLASAGCTTGHVEGTVTSKTQRAEKTCVKRSKYRAGGKRKCTEYGDVLHNYIIVAKDGDSSKTIEIEVTLDTYDHTDIGSHYSGAS